MIKKLLFFILLAGVTSFCKAQKSVSADSSYIFNFVQGRNMFYVPYKGNKQALTRLLGIIDRYREDILSGKIIVSVDGYCTDPRLAKMRSNRVKTEMILKGGLMEQCFSTTNHREKGDYVKVTLPLLDKEGSCREYFFPPHQHPSLGYTHCRPRSGIPHPRHLGHPH